MKPNFQYMYGNAYTLWTCPCGYFDDGGESTVDNKTNYKGGGVSNRIHIK